VTEAERDLGTSRTLRDQKQARELLELTDLAWWMNASGGPVDEMDASLASVTLLEGWFFEYLATGCPGVPRDALPWASSGFRMQEENVAQYFASTIFYYLRLVLQRVDPSAHWEVFVDPSKRVKRIEHLGIGIELANGTFVFPSFPSVFAERFVRQGAAKRGGAPWATILKNDAGPDFFPAEQERRESVLVPLLAGATDPLTRPPRDPGPVAVMPDGPVPHHVAYGAEMTFGIGPDDGVEIDKHGLMTPLPADRVAETLRRAGFTNSHGAEVTTSDLLVADARFAAVDNGDDLAQIILGLHEGTVRAIFIEGLAASKEEWEVLVEPFTALAAALGARFVYNSDWSRGTPSPAALKHSAKRHWWKRR
jgi:hypothetical protein